MEWPLKELSQPLKSSPLSRFKSSASSTSAWVAVLTIAVLLVHGYHPGAEDGGIYATGVYLRLRPTLFPHDTAFVLAPTTYSAFAWIFAGLSHLFRVSPDWVLLLGYVVSTALTLFAVQRLCRICEYDREEQLVAMALLAAWWTLPVAGTSLSIGDPYLTARSFSMPFSLFAISFALKGWQTSRGELRWRSVVGCVACLLAAAVMHRLMFGFAAVFVWLARAKSTPKWRAYFAGIGLCSLSAALVLQLHATPESRAFLHAEMTRQYWFLSEWRWYEGCGLIAPLLLFAVRLRYERRATARRLLIASIAAGLLALVVALLFAREDAARHIVARLQPLRMFMLLYVLLSVELSGAMIRFARALSNKVTPGWWRRGIGAVPFALTAVTAVCMYFVQKDSFSSSRHIEVPWNEHGELNPWVSAFLWCKQNTSEESFFAIDPTYIHQPQNDAQTFRAHALRSVLPDQSKDGGEAAVAPNLASFWQKGYEAQEGINLMGDADRLTRLRPLGVTWLLLSQSAQTNLPCPYRNPLIKVCRL